MAHKILFLAANPDGKRALDQQARAIHAELERVDQRERFEFVTRWAVQPLDFLRELVKLKPAVVHICGGRVGAEGVTSEPSPGVYFQAADGTPKLVTIDALARAFGAAGRSVKLVVLDACYSDAHAGILTAHIDCVVGIAGKTVDIAATTFASFLYNGLGQGESIATAFEVGCAAISVDSAGNPDQPQLRLRPGVDADTVVLAGPR